MKSRVALVVFVQLLLLSTSALADVHQSECLPRTTRETAKWPVRAVYLHGLFKGPGGPDQFGWRKLEAANRKKLEKIARKLKIRIAVPVAPVGGKTRVHQWNMTELPKIEASAAKACGVRKLPRQRALIGFSNGGYRARKIGLLSCAKTQDYEMILAVGAPDGTRGSSCSYRGKKKLVNIAPHVFNEKMILDRLENLSPVKNQKNANSGASDDSTESAPLEVPLPPVRDTVQ